MDHSGRPTYPDLEIGNLDDPKLGRLATTFEQPIKPARTYPLEFLLVFSSGIVRNLKARVAKRKATDGIRPVRCHDLGVNVRKLLAGSRQHLSVTVY